MFIKIFGPNKFTFSAFHKNWVGRIRHAPGNKTDLASAKTPVLKIKYEFVEIVLTCMKINL